MKKSRERKQKSVIADLIDTGKEELYGLLHAEWRVYALMLSILWTCFWITAADSESTEAFLIAVGCMLLGMEVIGLLVVEEVLKEKRRNK